MKGHLLGHLILILQEISEKMTALQTVNEHYQVIIAKNVEAICSKYVASEDTYVVLEGPRLTTKGYEKIKKGWTDFCQTNMLQLESINWIEGPFAQETKNMAWVAGIINLKVAITKTNQPAHFFENTFRASFILIKNENNEDWKIIHEHVSIANADPYGIGDWLKA